MARCSCSAESYAILAYFSGPNCNVCKIIKPKILDLLEGHFPEMNLYVVDYDTLPHAASRYGVLSIPTVIMFFGRRETKRLVRTFSIGELEQAISRHYELLFGD